MKRGKFNLLENHMNEFDPQFGQLAPIPTVENPRAGARLNMPQVQQMGGNIQGQPAFIRAPFYPTAPFYSTNPNVGYQTRFYSTGLNAATDTDYTVGSESIRRIQFDLPCRLIAMNGAAQTTSGVIGTLSGLDTRDLFLYRIEYTTGDQITVSSRLGSTILGTMENSGELGGTGYTINTGASLVIGITPLFTNLRIDITLVCLEMRGGSSYVR